MPLDQRASTPASANPMPCRTLFLSDLHLGALGSRSDLIVEFLESMRAETYVLVGDVLDLWRPMLPHWNRCDQAVIDHLHRRQAEGARIVYVRGNHDPDPNRAPAHARLRVDMVDRMIHTAGDEQRYLIVHGDQADSRLIRAHWVTRLGSLADHMLRRLDRSLRRLTGKTEGEARSLIEWVLTSVSMMSCAGRSHERRMVAMARQEGLDGVICGHFHIADLHGDHGLVYANCGDWVDSFTGLVEDFDGTLSLLGVHEVMTRGVQASAQAIPAEPIGER